MRTSENAKHRASPPRRAQLLAVDVFDQRLARAGLSLEDISRMTGLPIVYLKQQWSMGFPNVRPRSRIEAAMGYEMPAWSTRRELRQRRRCVELHGIDPLLATVVRLKSLAARLGIRINRDQQRLKPLLVKRLLEYVSVNGTPTTEPPL